jgi:hypothetical protein
MVEFSKKLLKDIGLQREVEEALPYSVVGGAWDASFQNSYDSYTALTHVVPHGHQLKILFLRVWTQNPNGARFSIVQVNPTAAGQTGDVEAYPVVGSVPEGVRDYPMLEAAGAEVLHGRLEQPIHVLEGSIQFNVLDVDASGYHYGIVWWGVEKVPEPKRA